MTSFLSLTLRLAACQPEQRRVIGLRCHIGQNAVIRNSILMGADMYDSADNRAGKNEIRPRLGVGANSVLDGVIADKNCSIGRGVQIQRHLGLEPNCDINGVYVRDGIIIVPKDSVLPDGWSLT